MGDIYSINATTYGIDAKTDSKDKIALEIGDSKQTEFFPQLKLMRWDNEVNLSVRLIEDDASLPVLSANADKVSWEKSKVKVDFYEVEGGLEFEVILKEKPVTNVIRFSIESKGLEFHYQPSLMENYKTGDFLFKKVEIGSVTETDVFDRDGNVLIHRAANAVSSYAIYHSGKRINKVDGKLYRNGKVCHLFRPLIGGEVWGDLSIDAGILTVVIPQDYLDQTTYPLRFAAGLEFGYHPATPASYLTWNTAYNPGANILVGARYTATTGDTITLFSVYAAADTGTDTFDMAAYTVTSNLPVTRLAAAITVSFNTTAAWKNSSAISQAMANGVNYCLAVGNGTASGHLYYDTVTQAAAQEEVSITLPATWNQDILTNYEWAIYATYTAAGGGYTDCPPPQWPQPFPEKRQVVGY